MLSGKTLRVASFQPPPAPQSLPLCSPLMTPDAGKFAMAVEEATAVEPLAAVAMLVAQGVGEGVGVGTTTAAQLNASTSTMRLKSTSFDELTTTRILSGVTGEKTNFRSASVLLVTDPPGTVAHAEPVQYCTSKSLTP